MPYWGQGLIPEAVGKLLSRCFTELDRTAVWCGYFEGDEKSKRVQEKCGFVYHHTEHNVNRFMVDVETEHLTRLTKEEWMRQQMQIEGLQNSY